MARDKEIARQIIGEDEDSLETASAKSANNAANQMAQAYAELIDEASDNTIENMGYAIGASIAQKTQNGQLAEAVLRHTLPTLNALKKGAALNKILPPITETKILRPVS